MIIAEADAFGRPARALLPPRPARRARSPRPSAAWPRARSASSSTRARRSSRSTRRSCESVFALADERRLPILVHAGRGIPALGRHAVELCERYPGHAADPRPRGDLRPVLDLGGGARAPEPLLRHRVVVAGRPARAVHARAAWPDPVRAATRPYGTPDVRRHRARSATRCRPACPRSRSGSVAGRRLPGSWPARTRSTPARRGPGALARPAARPRLHLPRSAPSARCSTGSTPPRRSPSPRWRARSATTRPRPRPARHGPAPARAARLQVAQGTNDGRPERFVPGLPMIVVAAGIARTPDVPMPPVGEPTMDVGERSA